jgi:hypothetical protein
LWTLASSAWAVTVSPKADATLKGGQAQVRVQFDATPDPVKVHPHPGQRPADRGEAAAGGREQEPQYFRARDAENYVLARPQ